MELHTQHDLLADTLHDVDALAGIVQRDLLADTLMTDNYSESECPRCGRDTDPEDLMDHFDLGPCCYRCACEHDFPPDNDFNLTGNDR